MSPFRPLRWASSVIAGLVLVLGSTTAHSQQTMIRPPTGPVPSYRLGIIDSRPVMLPIGGRPTPGLQVHGVEAYSPAAKAGLETGDILLTVNGTPLRTPDDMKWAMIRSRGVLRLKVRDVRLMRIVEVAINVPPGHGPSPNPGPFPPTPITVRGTLHLGVMAIGAETTGTVVDDGRGSRWELDFRHRPDLQAKLPPLDRRPVIVTGRPNAVRGVEISRRSILIVDDIQSAGIVPVPRANTAMPGTSSDPSGR